METQEGRVSLDIEEVEGVLERLLLRDGRPVLLAGESVPLDCAVAADGLLSLFVIAGEALWREVKEEGFALRTEPDDGALLGYKLTEIGARSFTAVMLATMEAMYQAARPNGIIVEDLDRVWGSSTKRFEAARSVGDADENSARAGSGPMEQAGANRETNR
jgi:hypothetical protein